MSAWQAAGQSGGEEAAARQLGGVAKAPASVSVTSGLAAVCEYVTTCVNNDKQTEKKIIEKEKIMIVVK